MALNSVLYLATKVPVQHFLRSGLSLATRDVHWRTKKGTRRAAPGCCCPKLRAQPLPRNPAGMSRLPTCPECYRGSSPLLRRPPSALLPKWWLSGSLKLASMDDTLSTLPEVDSFMWSMDGDTCKPCQGLGMRPSNRA